MPIAWKGCQANPERNSIVYLAAGVEDQGIDPPPQPTTPQHPREYGGVVLEMAAHCS